MSHKLEWGNIMFTSSDVFQWIALHQNVFPVSEILNDDYVPSAILDPLCRIQDEHLIFPCALWLLSCVIERKIDACIIKFDPIIQMRNVYHLYCDGSSINKLQEKIIKLLLDHNPLVTRDKPVHKRPRINHPIIRLPQSQNYQKVIAVPLKSTVQNSQCRKTLGDCFVIKQSTQKKSTQKQQRNSTQT